MNEGANSHNLYGRPEDAFDESVDGPARLEALRARDEEWRAQDTSPPTQNQPQSAQHEHAADPHAGAGREWMQQDPDDNPWGLEDGPSGLLGYNDGHDDKPW